MTQRIKNISEKYIILKAFKPETAGDELEWAETSVEELVEKQIRGNHKEGTEDEVAESYLSMMLARMYEDSPAVWFPFSGYRLEKR